MADEHTDFDTLLPELRAWNNGAGISARGYQLSFWQVDPGERRS